MKLVKRYQTKNQRYKNQVYISRVKGIMVHEIATNQEDPMVFVKGWNKSPISKAVHAFVGDGIVYETLPCDPGRALSGWHCGGSGNRSYISFEMCESRYFSWPKPYIAKSRNTKETNKFTRSVYETAVEYCAYKCKQFGWNPLEKGRIISHKEGHAMGIASNHGDPDSVWSQVTDATLTMNQFRKDVAKKLGKIKVEPVKKAETKEEAMVMGLQQALNLDYWTGLDVDGSYGPKTKSALSSHNIKSGSKANTVKWLQEQLNALGFTDANNKKLDVDGDFGQKTADALKKLQKKLGVSQDAEFGSGTMEKFIAYFNSESGKKDLSDKTDEKKTEDSGKKTDSKVEADSKKKTMIKGLQQALNKDYKTGLSVDGSYGPKTKSALSSHNIKSGSKSNTVKWLQSQLNAFGFTDGSNKKLEVDGDFGSKTAAALKKLQKKLGVSQDAEFGSGTMEKFIKLF